MKNHNRFIHTLLFMCLFINQVMAQETDSLKLEEIYVIKAYQPKIDLSGKKISLPVNPIPLKTKKLNVTYPFIEKDYPIEFHPSDIEPAKMKREKLPKLYKNYVRASAGNYLNTNFDLFHSNLRSSKKSLSYHLGHKGANSTLKDKGFAGFSENLIELDYKKKYDAKHYYFFSPSLHYNRYHLYGYDPVFYSDFNKKNTLQSYLGAALKAGYGNLHKDKEGVQSGYETTIFYRYWSDNKQAGEHNPIVTGTYIHPLNGKDHINITGGFDFNRFVVDSLFTNPQSNSIAFLRPEFNSQMGDFHFSAGLSLYADLEASNNQISLKPKGRVTYNLIEDIFTPFIEIDGHVRRNNFYSLSPQNPYLHSLSLNLKNTNTPYELKGGVRVSISDFISSTFYLSHQKNKQHAFFYNDSKRFFLEDTFLSVANRFNVLYDDLTTTGLHAEINIIKEKKYALHLLASNYIYQTQTENHPWYMPKVELRANGQYYLGKKLILSTVMLYQSKRFAKLYNFTLQKFSERPLPAFFDFNLGGEYRYSQKFSLFLKLQNILAKRYELWHNYPVQSIHVLGGFSLTF